MCPDIFFRAEINKDGLFARNYCTRICRACNKKVIKKTCPESDSRHAVNISVSLLLRLFSDNFKGNLNDNFFVELNGCVVVSDFFDGFFDFDDLAVHVEAELFEGFCDLDCVDRAEDCAGGACFCADGELDILKGSSESFGVSFDFGELVGALTLILSEHFEGGFGSDHGFTLRDKVIAAITRLNFHNIVFISEVGDIFFKYDLHNS